MGYYGFVILESFTELMKTFNIESTNVGNPGIEAIGRIWKFPKLFGNSKYVTLHIALPI